MVFETSCKPSLTFQSPAWGHMTPVPIQGTIPKSRTYLYLADKWKYFLPRRTCNINRLIGFQAKAEHYILIKFTNNKHWAVIGGRLLVPHRPFYPQARCLFNPTLAKPCYIDLLFSVSFVCNMNFITSHHSVIQDFMPKWHIGSHSCILQETSIMKKL